MASGPLFVISLDGSLFKAAEGQSTSTMDLLIRVCQRYSLSPAHYQLHQFNVTNGVVVPLKPSKILFNGIYHLLPKNFVFQDSVDNFAFVLDPSLVTKTRPANQNIIVSNIICLCEFFKMACQRYDLNIHEMQLAHSHAKLDPLQTLRNFAEDPPLYIVPHTRTQADEEAAPPHHQEKRKRKGVLTKLFRTKSKKGDQPREDASTGTTMPLPSTLSRMNGDLVAERRNSEPNIETQSAISSPDPTPRHSNAVSCPVLPQPSLKKRRAPRPPMKDPTIDHIGDFSLRVPAIDAPPATIPELIESQLDASAVSSTHSLKRPALRPHDDTLPHATRIEVNTTLLSQDCLAASLNSPPEAGSSHAESSPSSGVASNESPVICTERRATSPTAISHTSSTGESGMGGSQHADVDRLQSEMLNNPTYGCVSPRVTGEVSQVEQASRTAKDSLSRSSSSGMDEPPPPVLDQQTRHILGMTNSDTDNAEDSTVLEEEDVDEESRIAQYELLISRVNKTFEEAIVEEKRLAYTLAKQHPHAVMSPLKEEPFDSAEDESVLEVVTIRKSSVTRVSTAAPLVKVEESTFSPPPPPPLTPPPLAEHDASLDSLDRTEVTTDKVKNLSRFPAGRSGVESFYAHEKRVVSPPLQSKSIVVQNQKPPTESPSSRKIPVRSARNGLVDEEKPECRHFGVQTDGVRVHETADRLATSNIIQGLKGLRSFGDQRAVSTSALNFTRPSDIPMKSNLHASTTSLHSPRLTYTNEPSKDDVFVSNVDTSPIRMDQNLLDTLNKQFQVQNRVSAPVMRFPVIAAPEPPPPLHLTNAKSEVSSDPSSRRTMNSVTKALSGASGPASASVGSTSPLLPTRNHPLQAADKPPPPPIAPKPQYSRMSCTTSVSFSSKERQKTNSDTRTANGDTRDDLMSAIKNFSSRKLKSVNGVEKTNC